MPEPQEIEYQEEIDWGAPLPSTHEIFNNRLRIAIKNHDSKIAKIKGDEEYINDINQMKRWLFDLRKRNENRVCYDNHRFASPRHLSCILFFLYEFYKLEPKDKMLSERKSILRRVLNGDCPVQQTFTRMEPMEKRMAIARRAGFECELCGTPALRHEGHVFNIIKPSLMARLHYGHVSNSLHNLAWVCSKACGEGIRIALYDDMAKELLEAIHTSDENTTHVYREMILEEARQCMKPRYVAI